MALSLNPEIKKYSEQLSSGTGGELSSFASEIETGLEGVKGSVISITQGLSAVWRDSVSGRTINLMETANSKIDTQKSSLDAINSAAALVGSLKSASDAYVQAYESYKNSEYSKDNPPSDCEDEAAWRAEKTKRENAVKEKEEAALSAAQAVRGAFSGAGGSSSGGSSSGYQVTTLTGAELKSFCDANLVNIDRVNVEKATIEIGGVPFEVYYVYDKNLQSRDFENEAFRLYVDDCVEALGQVDDGLLEKLNSTDIIFEQTYACDKGHEAFGYKNSIAQAWYWANSHNVTVWFPAFGTNDGSSGYQYGVDSIIHEFGHVMDSTLGRSKTGDYRAFETETISLADSKWNTLIERESRKFKSLGIEGLCEAYNYDDYKESHSEYLAEFFYAYNNGYKELLARECPETYAEVERIINATKGIKG